MSIAGSRRVTKQCQRSVVVRAGLSPARGGVRRRPCKSLPLTARSLIEPPKASACRRSLFPYLKLIGTSILAACLGAAVLFVPVEAAENLRLAEGISFYQDIESGFPIVAEKMEDVTPSADGPTFIFFAASGDLNTNRQARRVVELYRRYRTGGVKFVVIDVDNPAGEGARQLIREHYRGYIPFQIILDTGGQKIWSQTGEVELRLLQGQLERALASRS